ncbi:MAG: response regulator transcription factor [Pseudomonadota bacterium]
MILILEDDQVASAALQALARDVAEEVHAARTLAEAKEILSSRDIRVVIADRMLPDGDGLEMVQSLRAASDSVQIMIVSALASARNKVKGLTLGADDYLPKPFEPLEFQARLSALLRRARLAEQIDDLITLGSLQIRQKARTVFVGEDHAQLSPKEFDLLLYLAENRGQVVTRSMLLEHVWGLRFDPQTNVVDVHMGRLRAKLCADDASRFIRTVRGKGYVLEADTQNGAGEGAA